MVEQAGQAGAQVTDEAMKKGGRELLRQLRLDTDTCIPIGPYTAENIATAVFKAMGGDLSVG